jgi:acyl-CoA synthetase (AMP-forming)/AMP-acid ligase II
MNTLQEILKGADDQEALIVPNGEVTSLKITYGELRLLICQLQAHLETRFTDSRNTVAMILPNNCEYIIAFFAIIGARGITAPLNPDYQPNEWLFYLKEVKANWIITSPSMDVAAIKKISECLGITVMVLSCQVDQHTHKCVSLLLDDTWMSMLSPHLTMKASSSDTAIMLHTGGTTGTPKLVPLTHHNLYVSSQNIAEGYQLNQNDRCLLVMPLFHVHGLIGCLLATLVSGGTVILPQKFSATTFWSICVNHRCTWYSAVPTIHIILLERERKQPTSLIANHQLRFIRSCSSYLSPSTWQLIKDTFHIPVLEAYGMTEASHQITTNQLDYYKKGSVGHIMGSVQIAIWHSDQVTHEPNVTGEIIIRGETVMKHYDGMPASTGFVGEEEHWFKTGDIGYLDSDGFLFLQGRSKYMINRGGEKILPLEILASSSSLTETELIHYCQLHLATFKCPKQIHFLDQFPKTATGKIHLPSLIQQIQSQIVNNNNNNNNREQ